ncbi:hypothetical protein HZA41_03170, partial [Candidatus Peregrinibacteria bacterium]|nr:hypothetical protein [Candidatus Peregrinibacteria bacterium]
MKILKNLFSSPHFWIRFIPAAFFIFALETFFLGLWKIPIINYSILYMEKVTDFDRVFALFFAVVFGFAVSLFWV